MKNYARIYRPSNEVPEDSVRIPEVPPCPFIVGFHGAFTDNDRTLNLAMEYMDKGNLTVRGYQNCTVVQYLLYADVAHGTARS